jgi:prepilin-type N-terminal cleavage/methylation domain-containing protein
MVSRKHSGFTLVELLVVVAVLAVLAGLLIPKFDSVQSKANHGAAASSVNDVGRLIQTFKVTKNRYPNGWDSLIDPATGNLWTAATLDLPQLNSGLTGVLDPTKAKLTTTTVTAGQLGSLGRRGITTIYNLTAASTANAGDRFTTAETISATSKIAVLNRTTTAGKKIIDHIYPANLRPGGTSGTIPTNKELAVFGFGNNNELIGTSILETPFYGNADPVLVYNRLLVVFEVDANGGNADFKGVLAADGDLLNDMINNFFK